MGAEILKACGGSLHSNQEKTVLWVHIPHGMKVEGLTNEQVQTQLTSLASSPCKGTTSTLFIETAEPLEFGLPVQVMFEVVPIVQAANNMDGNFMYRARISLIKARVKPGTSEFTLAESQELEDIVNGTEDVVQDKQKARKLVAQIKKKEHEANRFTGLEI